jgi:N6-adenosine-specific RNA methylase IME4
LKKLVAERLPARLAREFARATPVSLRLDKSLPFARWREIGQQLCAMERGVQWWIGDWWAFGSQTYGERAQAAASGIFGRSFGGLKNLGSTARAFGRSRRRDLLSFTHHAEVAALEPAQADALLEEAERKGFSTRDLRDRVDAIKRGDHLARIEAISLGNGPLPTGRRFPVIYADPPWRYDNAPAGDPRLAVENHYPTKTLDEICALQVATIAANDAILFLWTTAPMLPVALQVITAWGFEYKTCMIWVKDKVGLGYHVRGQHELLLIAKRGDMPTPLSGTQPPSVVVFAERGEHSVKPERFYEIIEGLYPGVGKIELYARSPREGWAAWGNQVSRLRAAES